MLANIESLQKFSDPQITAKGERRAAVGLRALETLWFNTGTLCNITCANCYIESSPRNDRLAYLTLADVSRYLDEIERDRLPVELIGFTGGEPFMNPEFPAILETTLARGFQTLTLTNAMRPMTRRKAQIAAFAGRYGGRLRLRVSLDDWRQTVHDAERGAGSFEKTLAGLAWLTGAGAAVEIAGRFLSGDDEAAIRAGYAGLFAQHGIAVDCADPMALVLLPEMSPEADPPEITEACWGILHKSPEDVMCASARMVVKRKGADAPAVLACTLIPYDERFELGASLREASGSVALNHKYCATFCVLGGAVCGKPRSES
ncbi:MULTISPECIES: radical SAM protein [Rhodomicrobium]|uniref:radical SAM protein n=1 Tax=Rhodomicrobium TaxID=1068 RepID=UPI000B4A863E|nr:MULTISPECIES: radical SAM protein [Rhodomicrobium]